MWILGLKGLIHRKTQRTIDRFEDSQDFLVEYLVLVISVAVL